MHFLIVPFEGNIMNGCLLAETNMQELKLQLPKKP